MTETKSSHADKMKFTKMTLEEVAAVAERYRTVGRLYIAIGDKLMDIATGQMMLFKAVMR